MKPYFTHEFPLMTFANRCHEFIAPPEDNPRESPSFAAIAKQSSNRTISAYDLETMDIFS